MSRRSPVLPLALPAAGLTGGEYVRLLPPIVIEQLDPDAARLVNNLPEVDGADEASVGRLFAPGGLSHAELGREWCDGDDIGVPHNEFISRRPCWAASCT